MKKTVLLLAFSLSLGIASAQSINYEGRNIFINGANIPWISFGSDVGNAYSASGFESIFTISQQYGINCLRLWIHCDGRCSPLFDSTGKVTGLNTGFISSLDDIFLRAKNHNVMIMPCLWSFDMLKTNKTSAGKFAGDHADLITDSTKTASYIDSVLIPIVTRYKDQCNLFAWEIINEPEWGMTIKNVTSTDMQMVSANQMQSFVGKLAGAIHRNSKKMVTVGSASLQWSSTAQSCVGNFWTDSLLKTASNDSLGFLDFYQVHYYDWMYEAFDPFDTLRAYNHWNIDKPLLLGEVDGNNARYPPAAMVNDAYRNKYCGLMYWSINANDGVANFGNFKIALSDFRIQHKDSVAFSCDSVIAPLDTIFYVSTNNITLNTDSNSSAQFSISSNIAWKLTSNQPWLTLSSDTGLVSKTIMITANSAAANLKERDALLTMSATGLPSQTISIIQSAPVFNVSPNKISLRPVKNSQATFAVYSNMKWTMSNIQNWLSVTPDSGNGQKTITVSTLSSADTTRTDTIFISTPRMKTIQVIISQVVPIIYAPDSVHIDSTTTVSIISNVKWNVSIDSAWLTANVASGSNNGVITLTATRNNTNSLRTTAIILWGINVSPKTITIIQAPFKAMIAVSSDSLNIDSTATFTISSNTSWNVAIDESWLTSNIDSGLYNSAITLTASNNNLDSSRTAIITISGIDVDSKTVTVIQAPLGTEISNEINQDIYIYPTLVKDKLYIACQKLQNPSRFTIYSSNGMPMYKANITNSITEVDMSNYPSGLYFVKIITSNEGFLVKKFTKL